MSCQPKVVSIFFATKVPRSNVGEMTFVLCRERVVHTSTLTTYNYITTVGDF